MTPYHGAARRAIEWMDGGAAAGEARTQELARILKAELAWARPMAVTAAVIRRGDGRVLLAKRPGDGPQDGHFEFPGGKIEFGETPEASLEREIEEELGCTVRVDELLSVETEIYDGRRHILLLTYFCTLLAVDESFAARPEIAWVDPARNEDAPLSVLPPDRRNLDRMREGAAADGRAPHPSPDRP